MNVSSLLIVALATGALAAQDAPRLDGRFQVFAELSRPASIVVAQAPGDISDQPRRQTGVGFRFMGEIASSPGWYYEVGGMFDGSSYFTINNGTTLNLTDVKVTNSYWTLGAGYLGKLSPNFTWGAHLEARGEYLRIQGEADVNGTASQLDTTTTYLRPWLRGSIDYTITSIGQQKHPFVGFEGCFALMKTSQTKVPDFTDMDGRTLRALAPRASAALYVGLRF